MDPRTNVSYQFEDPNLGLSEFQAFYQQNTGIPGWIRQAPRPMKKLAHTGNGVERLMQDTQNLRYATPNGQAPEVTFPNVYDTVSTQFNVVGNAPGDCAQPLNIHGKKEKCGCGGPLLFTGQ